MKKFKVLIAFIITVCLTMAVTGCGTSKTTKREFRGKISELSYSTAKEAAEAFFSEQIDGDYEDCKFSGYSTKKALSKNDIGDLELGDLDEKDIISGEKGRVSFSYGSEVFSSDIYLLQTDEGYHYYTLMPDEDEAVPVDYYDFLLNEEVFKSVTVKTNGIVIVEEEGYSRQSEISIEIVKEENEYRFQIIVKNFFNGGINETLLGGYILVDADGNYSAYGLQKGEYVEITRELNAMFSESAKQLQVYFINQLSCFYLNGHHLFKMGENSMVLREREKALMTKSLADLYYGEGLGTVDSFAYELTAVDHKMSEIFTTIHGVNAEANQELFVTVDKTFTRYGESKVEIPQEVYTLWENR